MTRVLDRVVEERGLPEGILVDHLAPPCEVQASFKLLCDMATLLITSLILFVRSFNPITDKRMGTFLSTTVWATETA